MRIGTADGGTYGYSDDVLAGVVLGVTFASANGLHGPGITLRYAMLMGLGSHAMGCISGVYMFQMALLGSGE